MLIGILNGTRYMYKRYNYTSVELSFKVKKVRFQADSHFSAVSSTHIVTRMETNYFMYLMISYLHKL